MSGFLRRLARRPTFAPDDQVRVRPDSHYAGHSGRISQINLGLSADVYIVQLDAGQTHDGYPSIMVREDELEAMAQDAP